MNLWAIDYMLQNNLTGVLSRTFTMVLPAVNGELALLQFNHRNKCYSFIDRKILAVYPLGSKIVEQMATNAKNIVKG